MPSIPSLLFATLLLILTYLTHLSLTSPNPPPSSLHSGDRIIKAHLISHHKFSRSFLTCLWLHHILLVPTLPNPPAFICLIPENLSQKLFTWSPYTVICCIFIISGATLRLRAYAQLGPNFTFELAHPSGLVTGGLYRYVQHPSYTGLMLLAIGVVGIVLRTDAGVGCWLPPRWLQGVWGEVLGWVAWLVLAIGVAVLGVMRIRDEEGMMREAFGREWDDWARVTQRLVPGVW